ncbi:MAG: hypothetical protein NWF07_17310 [Candidatus Bathyarchaeota archaeon]|nr:hypothetical protein [Candidatus Bathyarchaeota archaeon]
MSKQSKKGKPKSSPLRKSRIEIPKKYISVAVVAFCLFIIGGGVYNILEEPNSMVTISSTSYSFLHPYTNEQTSTEGYVVMLVDSFLIAGLYMTYRSTQIAYNRSSANRWLMFGIILIILGFGGNYALLRIKAAVV